jgi:hypothetical protein
MRLIISSTQIWKELHKSCRKEDGTDDHKKGTQLLEVYAIEIQMYIETKNNKKLKVRVLKLYLTFSWLFFLSRLSAFSSIIFLTVPFNHLYEFSSLIHRKDFLQEFEL